MENKPQKLYRGIKLYYHQLEGFSFSGVDLVPPHEAKYDSFGRKVVGDGNEYGLYMSDNQTVASELYSTTDLKDYINKSITFGSSRVDGVMLPSIGVVYGINTQNINIRKPKLYVFNGPSKNNGVDGEEWITDRVPSSEYQVELIKIGKDTLNEGIKIDCTNVKDISAAIKREVDKRVLGLNLFEHQLEKMTPDKRKTIDDIDVFKTLFKKDGIFQIDLNNFTMKNGYDCILYMMTMYYKSSPEDLKINELKTLNAFLKNKNLTFDGLDDCLEDILKEQVSKKDEYVNRKNKNGEIPNTKGFDNKIAIINSIIELKHQVLFNQAVSLTGVTINPNIHSVNYINQKLSEMIVELELLLEEHKITVNMFSAVKKEVINEMNRLVQNINNSQANSKVNSINTPSQKSINEEAEWEAFKEKYDYDEMSFQEQLIVEEKFREMIDSRKMTKIEKVEEVENPERRVR